MLKPRYLAVSIAVLLGVTACETDSSSNANDNKTVTNKPSVAQQAQNKTATPQIARYSAVANNTASQLPNYDKQPNKVPVGQSFNLTVGDLAQGCYAIQSPKTGKYITSIKTNNPVNDGLSYQFGKGNPAKFYFKPTDLDNKFMLRDTQGRYFGTHNPLQISAGKTVGEYVEWKIDRIGADRYQLKAVKLNRKLKHVTRNGKAILHKMNWFAENNFRLVSQKGCSTFPEVTTNVKGSRELLKGDVNQPVRGFIDPHTHITSYEFMGGRMMAGEPFNKWGVEEAIKDGKDKHGEKGSLDVIGNLFSPDGLKSRHDTTGWPEFSGWATYKQFSHMGYYYKWIERAYLSGLRIMQTNLVENEVLCNVQRGINPSGWVSQNDCKTMNSLYNQIDSLYALQDYVDAQAGGKGKGFFRIVTSPAQARQVIANGQLAVVIGIEASETFDCGINDTDCSKANIDKDLEKLHKLGVRALFPIHKFDNKFGGSAVEGDFINVGNFAATGAFFETEQCDDQTLGIEMKSIFPVSEKMPILKKIVADSKLNLVYQPGKSNCNKKGLTNLGSYLVNRMIDKKMIIEFDHMSNKSASSVLDIAEKRNFSGLMTSHSWMRRAPDPDYVPNPDKEHDKEKGKVDHYNVKKLLQMGGFAGAYNFETYEMADWVDNYLTAVEETPYLRGVGISTDMSGLGDQAPPRRDASEKPLQYPFTTEFGMVIDKQKSGNREYDISKTGMAHYGLLGDHVEDIRQRTDKRIYEALMNSAEAYLQMWERAENAPTTEHYNPLG